MSITTISETADSETLAMEMRWKAWVEKGLASDRAAAQKMKVAAGLVAGFAAIAVAIYLGR